MRRLFASAIALLLIFGQVLTPTYSSSSQAVSTQSLLPNPPTTTLSISSEPDIRKLLLPPLSQSLPKSIAAPLVGPPTHLVNVSKQTVYLVLESQSSIYPLQPNDSVYFTDVEAVWSKCSPGSFRCVEHNGHWMRVYKLGGSLDISDWVSAIFTTYTAQGADEKLVILAGSSDCLGGCGWIEPPPEWPKPSDDVPYILVSCAKHFPFPPEDPGHLPSCPLAAVPRLYDDATFTYNETPGDDYVASPGQSIYKTWWMRNSGSTTWGSGYQLVFTGGDQMGAPSTVSIPTTAPGEVAPISVAVTAPSQGGIYRGYWKLRNPQGTYFGDHLWVQITVPDNSSPPPPSDAVEIIHLDYPSVVAPSATFRPTIRVRINSGQLLASRGDMLRNVDGNLFGAHPHVAVEGTVNTGQTYDFTFYPDSPVTAPNSDGVYETKWRIWQNGNWIGPEITLRFEVSQSSGSNYRPNRPTLTGPGDWAIFQGTPVVLTAQHNGDPDGDTITGYYFELLGPNPRNSGWISSNTWNPTGLPYSNYEWRVKVRDSHGAESDWSPQTWHFTVLNNEPEIYEFYTTTCRDAWGGPEKICFCAKTNAGTLQLQVNTATDGSDQGEWRIINELGVPEYRCQDDSDRPPNTNNLEWETGTHRARLYARREGGWENAAYQDITFSLPAERRPNSPYGQLPLNDSYVNSRTVHIDWLDTLRTTGYTLTASTDSAFNTLLIDEYFSVGTSEYTHTFDSDYETVYLRVTSTGPYGTNDATWRFHIDLDPPASAILALPPVTTDTKFTLQWGGSDSRSGLRWYHVQVCESDRPDSQCMDWLVNTTKTTEMFQAQPGHTYCFRVRAMDEVGNWEDWPTGEGDTCTLVDPSAAPPTPYWDPAYAVKRNLIILNNDNDTMPVDFPICAAFDESSDPTAVEIYNTSQTAAKGDDVRIVYNNQVELDRFVQRFTLNQIIVCFPLQAPLGGKQTDNSSYQIYYGNAEAGSSPADVNAVFLPTVDGNTVALWHFQEGSGGTVFDNSGHGHHGTFHSAGWVDGFLGTAGEFNGSTAYVDAGNSSDFNLAAGPMTIEAWVYLTGDTGNYPHVVSKWGPGDGSYFLRIMGGKNPQWAIRSGGDIAAGTSLELNQWYHIAATYDGINTMRLYINGVQVASKTNAKDGLSTARRLFIGWAEEGADGGHFPGYIQHVRISNVARSDFPYARINISPSVEAGVAIPPPTTSMPDLAILDLTTFPNPGGGVLVQVVVQNQGGGDAQGDAYIDLYLDHIPTGAGDYTGSFQFWINSPIKAGDTVTVTKVITSVASLSIPDAQMAQLDAIEDLSAGSEVTGTLYAQVDSTGVISETDNVNNIYTAGTGFCLNCPDAYEGDDTLATAQTITLGETQLHNIDGPGDQDWLVFTAQGGMSYIFQTSDLDLAADTYLYLHDTDGVLLASNDDYGDSLASRIEWTAPITGTYYLVVEHWNPNIGGCGTNYQLSFDSNPTAVSLASFTAGWEGDQVLVAWETALEINTVGFWIWRSTASEGDYVQVNDELIPSVSPGGTTGNSYLYVDSDVTPGKVYYYKLEELEVSGVRNWYGPTSTEEGNPTSVTLFAVMAEKLSSTTLVWWSIAATIVISATLAALVCLRRRR